MADLAKFVQNERTEIHSLDKEDGNASTPGKETLELLVKTHFPHTTHRKRYKYTLEGNIELANFFGKYEDWVTKSTIKKALRNFKSKKSPGPDGYRPVIFKHLPEHFVGYLRLIYVCCIHFHYTPTVSYTHLTLPTIYSV